MGWNPVGQPRATDPAGFPIDTSRPKLQNADGSFSTEQTITVEMDGRHYNIPTIVNGKRVGDDEAVAHARKAMASGQQYPNFGSMAEAESAAVQRSNAIGTARGTSWKPKGEARKIKVFVPELPNREPAAPLVPPQASWADTLKAIPTQVQSYMAQTIAGMKARHAAELRGVTGERGYKKANREFLELFGKEGDPAPKSNDVTVKRMQETGKRMLEEETATARAAQEGAKEVTPENQSLMQRATGGAATSLAVTLPAMLVGIVTRSPEVAASTMFPIVSGQKFGERAVKAEDAAAAERAKSGDNAAAKKVYEKLLKAAGKHADLQGMVEVGTEWIPAKVLFKNGTPFFKRLANFLAAELPGESVATVVQTLDDHIADLPDDVTAQDFLDGLSEGIKALPETWATVALTAGPHVAIGQAANRKPVAKGAVAPEKQALDTELPAVEPDAPAQSKAPPPNPQFEYFQEQRGRNQEFGSQFELRPLTEKDFQENVKPLVSKGYADSLADYQKKHPNATHVLLERTPSGSYRTRKVGAADNIRPSSETVKRFDTLDDEGAKEWGSIDASLSQRVDPNRVNWDEDSLLTAVSKLGGISRTEAEAQGIDSSHFQHRGHRINLTFRNSGMSFDAMAELLAEHGYPVTDARGNYDPNVLLDRIGEELAGNAIFSNRSKSPSHIEQLEARGRDEDERLRRAQSFRPATEDDLIELYSSYPDVIDTDEPVGTLHEFEHYPTDFDEHARKLTDLAEMASAIDENAAMSALERSGSDSETAKKLWAIIEGAKSEQSAKADAEAIAEPVEAGPSESPEGSGVSEEETEAEEITELDDDIGTSVAAQTDGLVTTDEEIRLRGEPILSSMDAQRRYSDGDQLFGQSEMDEEFTPITSFDMLQAYAPDHLVALPRMDSAGDSVVTVDERDRDKKKLEYKLNPEPTPSGPGPIAPPGDRWTADRGAIPGESFAFLDGDHETGSAAIVEIDMEDGSGSIYEARYKDGTEIGRFSTEYEAALAAEEYVDRKKAESQTKAEVSEEERAGAAEDLASENARYHMDDGGWSQLSDKEKQAHIDAGAHEAATSPKNDLPLPSAAQKEAENYKVGAPVVLHGYTVRVENPKGSYRTNFDPKKTAEALKNQLGKASRRHLQDALKDYADGDAEGAVMLLKAAADTAKTGLSGTNSLKELAKATWANRMPAHYGRILGTTAPDGDHIDVFLGPQSADESLPVIVIDTKKRGTDTLDEYKVMMGFSGDGSPLSHVDASIKAFRESYKKGIADDITKHVSVMTPAEFREWLDSGDHKRAAFDWINDKHPSTNLDVKLELVGKNVDLPANAPESKVAPTDERQPTQETSAGALEGAQAADVPRAGEIPAPEQSPGRSGGADESGNARVDRKGTKRTRGVGADQGNLFDAPARVAEPVKRPEPARPDAASAERIELRDEPLVQRGSRDRLGGDYFITDADALGEGGPKTKVENNLAAIRMVKRLSEVGRQATPDEQAILVKYVGWGGLPQVFDERKDTFSKEREELLTLLTAEEYESARGSTQDAHYTSTDVVKAIYDGIRRLGFKSGKILEPSVGTGNFIGLMPGDMRGGTTIVGVELDTITGEIAKQLYPGSRISAPMGFQDFATLNDSFDAAIGNPPFGNKKLFDRHRKHLNQFSIHNYFFTKSIESLRPGGVQAMVVSHFFMDAREASARRFIADRADLVGAIRLPDTAFKKNAGTEVTTDIVFFRKRMPGEPSGDDSWVGVSSVKDKETGRSIPLNSYFVEHPDMMLGEMTLKGTMYGPDGSATLTAPDGLDIAKALDERIAKLPEGIYTRAPSKTTELQEAATRTLTGEEADGVKGVKLFGHFVTKDGKIARRLPDVEGQVVVEDVPMSGTALDRAKSLIELRDTAYAQLRMELNDSPQVEANRRKLNSQYDSLVKKFGYVHSTGNVRAFDEDPGFPLLLSLETDYDAGITKERAKKEGLTAREPSAHKGAIFSRPVNLPYRPITSVTTAHDGLLASLTDRGRVDIQYIEQLYGKPWSEISDELGDLVYETPAGEWQTADHYLSGNIKKKLAQAKKAAEKNKRFTRNVVALEPLVPADLDATQIKVKMGSGWIPGHHIADFANHLFGDTARTSANYLEGAGKWAINIDGGGHLQVFTTWGTPRKSGIDILEATLNGKPINVYDETMDGSRVLNMEASSAAQGKQAAMMDEFQNWIWKDENRRRELVRIYNDKFNHSIERRYDGSHLPAVLPGANPSIQLRESQRNAVWRFVQQRGGLADHVVGAGKTFIKISTVMELKRLGMVRKPVVSVPNHLVAQWGEDWARLYPGANVLVATKKDFEKQNRRKFIAKVATGDWDAVIMAHSSFELIGVPIESLQQFTKEQVELISQAIDTLKAAGGRNLSVKDLEKVKDKLEERLEEKIEAKEKDNHITFDEMGVDFIGVDEFHLYKNLGFATSLGRTVQGLGNTSGSQKAMDLFIKLRYVQSRANGANVLALTGTPITNSISEMYNVMRYLDYDNLKAAGMMHFDAWFNTFGSAESGFELDTGLKYKPVTRLRSFLNMPELMTTYRRFSDVIQRRDLEEMRRREGKPPLTPPVKGGKPTNLVIERTTEQGIYMEKILERIENMRSVKDKSIDNMLKVTTDSLKMSLDIRLVNPNAVDEPGSKVNTAADEIFNRYKQWADKRGTQLVFCDMSMPKQSRAAERAEYLEIKEKASQGDDAAQSALEKYSLSDVLAFEGSDFSVYDDLKAKLIKKGIPESEIAFIHDYNTDLKKAKLFASMNKGEMRVLIGSTMKMGAGMNVQRRLVALHHLDCPWRPADLEQRDGRIIRQGNMLYEGDSGRGVKPIDGFEIEILRYAVRNTYDARRWQVIENKAKFIEEMRRAGLSDREVADIGGEAASAAEMKAAAAGNPLILEVVELESEIRKLESQRAEFNRSKFTYQDMANRLADWKGQGERRISVYQDDIKRRHPKSKDSFTISVGGKTYTERKAAGNQLLLKLVEFAKTHKDTEENVGSYRGFELHFVNENAGLGIELQGRQNYVVFWGKDTPMDPVGAITRLDNALEGLEESIERIQRTMESERKQHEVALERRNDVWQNEETLKTKKVRHAEIIKLLAKADKNTGDQNEPDVSASYAENDYFSEAAAKRRAEFREATPIESVRQHFSRIQSRWSGADVKVHVRRNLYDVPNKYLRIFASRGAADRVKAFFDPNAREAYILFDTMESMREAEEALFHEVEGHLSIRQFFGPDIIPFLNRVYMVDPQGVKAVGRDYGFYDKDNKPTAMVGRSERNARLFAAEEYIAHMAETLNSNSPSALRKAWDWLVSHFAEFMRKRGWTHFPPTEAEIRGWLVRAQRNLKTGAVKNPLKSASLAELIKNSPVEADVAMKLARSDAADRRGKWAVNEMRKGQPIDKVFRAAFSPFGYVDERGHFRVHAPIKRVGRRALDAANGVAKSTKFVWMNHMGGVAAKRIADEYGLSDSISKGVEAAKRGLIDRYGLGEEYRRRDLQREADKRTLELEAMDVFERLVKNGVDTKEAEVLYDVLTGNPVDDSRMERLAEPIRLAIDQMGAEAVELGLLSREAYERNKGAYLHRTYLKHEADAGTLSTRVSNMLSARRKRIIGNQFKGRGIFQKVKASALLANIPSDWWGQARPVGRLHASLIGQKFLILDRVEQFGEGTETIAGMEPKKVKERVKQRIYWPADRELPSKFAAWTNRGEFEIRDVNGDEATLWRDYTKVERTRMGEILDARYAIIKTYQVMARDLATGRFLRDIAQNHDWARKSDPTGDSPEARELGYGLYVDHEWVRVPQTTVAGTKTARWGALSGMYVRSEIWRDLNELDRMQRGGFWQTVLTHWKLNKTARNPVVHLNNIMSNLLLMDMADVRGRDLVRGFRSYVTKDEHYRDALKHGAFGGDFISQEVRDKVLKPILEELSGKNAPKPVDQYSIYDIGMRILSGIRKVDELMISAYQVEDEIFRMAMYMRQLSMGETPEAAAHSAREQFLNYDIRAPWINALRRSVMPFIGYTYRAVPVIAKAVYDRPWKVAKYATIGYLLNALGYALDGDEPDEEEERRLLPEQEQGLTWLGLPRLIRTPAHDALGQGIYLDVRRWIPAGDVFDFNQSQGAIPVPAPLQFGGPMAMAFELAFNKISFTGEQIYNPLTDTGGERFSKVGDYLWKSYAPSAPWVPGSWYWDKIGRSMGGTATDSFGREYSLGQSVASSVGVKLKPFDAEIARAQRQMDFERVNRELDFELRQLARERGRNLIDDEELQKRLEVIKEKKRRLGEKARETFYGPQE